MKRPLFVLPIVLLLGLALLLAAGTPSASAQTSDALWFISYWDNPNQEGDPVRTGSEGNIDHDWGTGVPVNGVPADKWSARWTSYVEFDPGTYRFTITSDDGARIFLGSRHVMVDWAARPEKTHVTTVSLTGGTYPVAIDYFDDVGAAVLELTWERVGTPLANVPDVTVISSSTGTAAPAPVPVTGSFRGEYFNNRTLTGQAALVRNDAAINFNWGSGSPATGLNSDNFSVRWTGSLDLIPGRYRFTVTADDGVRLWLNDELTVDRWVDQELTTVNAELDWAGGTLPIELTYYDRGGFAQVSLTWTRIGPAANTGGPGIGAVNVSGLNVRTGPSTSFQRITTIPFGTVVTLLGRNADSTWVYAQLPDGRQGWMSAGYLNVTIPLTELPILL